MKYKNLIEKLVKKCSPICQECSHPILIGDVAFRIAEKYHAEEFTKINGLKINDFKYSNVPELFYLWYLCGKNKSLQEISEDMEEVCMDCPATGECECVMEKGRESTNLQKQLRPEASQLLNFLNDIFID